MKISLGSYQWLTWYCPLQRRVDCHWVDNCKFRELHELTGLHQKKSKKKGNKEVWVDKKRWRASVDVLSAKSGRVRIWSFPCSWWLPSTASGPSISNVLEVVWSTALPAPAVGAVPEQYCAGSVLCWKCTGMHFCTGLKVLGTFLGRAAYFAWYV